MKVKNFEKQIGDAKRRTHNLSLCSEMSYHLATEDDSFLIAAMTAAWP